MCLPTSPNLKNKKKIKQEGGRLSMKWTTFLLKFVKHICALVLSIVLLMLVVVVLIIVLKKGMLKVND